MPAVTRTVAGVCSIEQRVMSVSTTLTAMLTPPLRDVILRGSIDGAFHVLDAANRALVTGPLPFVEALAFARESGAQHIYQQPVDERGRILGDPSRLT